MMAGAIVLAMYDARRTTKLWRVAGVRASEIAAQLGCDPAWPEIEAHIVDALVLSQIRGAGVAPLKVGALPAKRRLAA